KGPITEVLDLYPTPEVTAEIGNSDTDIALESLIDGYLETLETWMSKPKELEKY
ncbi:19416_t:CDS:1, partial [Racocetra persica]